MSLAANTTPRSTSEPVRVLVADDHPLVRDGITAVLDSAPDMHVVGATGLASSTLELVETLHPDVLLLDLGLPDQSGFEVAHRVHSAWPDVAVLVLTGYNVGANTPLLTRLGVRGVVHKSAPTEQLISAIRTAAQGRSLSSSPGRDDEPVMADPLTTREVEVLALVAAGLRNAEIAAELHVSINTVEFHMRNLLGKLGARSRTQAISKARSMGYLLPEETSFDC